MGEEQSFHDVHHLAYAAIDACVAEVFGFYAGDSPVPLVVHWRALSAGSSLHQLTDVGGNEIVRAVVRLQPEDAVVTTVNVFAANPKTAPIARNMVIGVRQVVAQHRANLSRLKAHGIGASPALALPPPPPPPPKRGDTEGKRAILEWYAAHNPRATNKEIAEYCKVAEPTVKGWRGALEIPKQGPDG